MKLQTSGVLGTSYAIAKLAPKRGLPLGYERRKLEFERLKQKFNCYETNMFAKKHKHQ